MVAAGANHGLKRMVVRSSLRFIRVDRREGRELRKVRAAALARGAGAVRRGLVDVAQIEQTTAQGDDVANMKYGIAAQLILRVEIEVLKIGIPESRRYRGDAEGGCRTGAGKRVHSCADLEGRRLRDREDRA